MQIPASPRSCFDSRQSEKYAHTIRGFPFQFFILTYVGARTVTQWSACALHKNVRAYVHGHVHGEKYDRHRAFAALT